MREFADLVWHMPAADFVLLIGGLLFALMLWATALAVVKKKGE